MEHKIEQTVKIENRITLGKEFEKKLLRKKIGVIVNTTLNAFKTVFFKYSDTENSVKLDMNLIPTKIARKLAARNTILIEYGSESNQNNKYEIDKESKSNKLTVT